jgi:hypothetical protein
MPKNEFGRWHGVESFCTRTISLQPSADADRNRGVLKFATPQNLTRDSFQVLDSTRESLVEANQVEEGSLPVSKPMSISRC